MCEQVCGGKCCCLLVLQLPPLPFLRLQLSARSAARDCDDQIGAAARTALRNQVLDAVRGRVSSALVFSAKRVSTDSSACLRWAWVTNALSTLV